MTPGQVAYEAARDAAFGSAIADTDKRIAAGAALDAERRGDVYDPCRGCIHEAHELTCMAVIDAGRAQRCGCRTRKSESLKES